MKIALFNWRDLAHPASGGAEVFTEQVLRHWSQWGHEVTLFSSAVDGRPAVEHVDGIRHIRGGSRFGVYREARKWWSQSGVAEGFDLVIDEVNTRPFACHEWVTGVPVAALMFQLAREVWFFEMPLPAALLGRYVLEPRWLRSMRHAPIMTISESSRRSFVDNGLQRVSVLPVGIEPDADSADGGRESANPTVVFVGRMAANKRPHHAVRAVEIARQFIPDLKIHLVGDGPLRAGLARRGEHVVAHGFVSADDKRRIVSNAHAQVVTSVREGWGLVVDEAARLGTPSFAYNVAGLCDSVEAADGFVVPPRPEAMAEALIEHLPSLVSSGARPGWSGGAVAWDDVAAATLATAVDIAHVADPLSPSRPTADLRIPIDLRPSNPNSIDRIAQ